MKSLFTKAQNTVSRNSNDQFLGRVSSFSSFSLLIFFNDSLSLSLSLSLLTKKYVKIEYLIPKGSINWKIWRIKLNSYNCWLLWLQVEETTFTSHEKGEWARKTLKPCVRFQELQGRLKILFVVLCIKINSFKYPGFDLLCRK